MTNQNAEQIVAEVGGENPFAVAMLQLCEISYFYSGIREAVPQVLALTPGGAWCCEWGPASDRTDSNLAFVACYYPLGASSPMFTCVVIRGTDLDILDPFGILWQIWEDLDPEYPVPLSWTSNAPAAAIAGGTAEGLQAIQSLLSNGGPTLKEWLASFLASTGLGKLVVTGHSLGGCLTTVVAPWLQTVLTGYTGPILPVTFAAPTAGNPAFATYFNNLFTYSLLYQNPLDVAPLAYGSLPDINNIYISPTHNLPMPWELADVLSWIEGELDGIPYGQPNSNAPPLELHWHKTTSWLDEAWYQHHPATYMSLLDGTNIGTPSRFTSRRGTRSPMRIARAG